MRRFAIFLPPLGALAVFAAVALSLLMMPALWTSSDGRKTETTGSGEIRAEPEDNAAKEMNSVPELTDAELAEMSARPLFQKGRRVPNQAEPAPVPQAVAAPPPVQPYPLPQTESIEPPALRMRGYVAGEGGASALVFSPRTSSENWVKTGDEIDGWVVRGISAGAIQVESDEQEFTIKLYE